MLGIADVLSPIADTLCPVQHTPPEYLVSAIAGMKALSKNGFRYPFAQYGVQQDVRVGMAVSYPGRA